MKRTTPPSDLNSLRYGERLAEDNLHDIIKQFRSDVGEGEPEPRREKPASDSSAGGQSLQEPPRACSPAIPGVIQRVLNGPHKAELVAVATMLEAENQRQRSMRFPTPIGIIRCRINWISCEPRDIVRQGLFFVKMPTTDQVQMFVPTPGAQIQVGFDDAEEIFDVVCLAEPQQIYPGVDLLCFMSHTSPVEKNGKLNDHAPSVVSGEPSDSVKQGEPVRSDESPAELDKRAMEGILSQAKNWDVARPS